MKNLILISILTAALSVGVSAGEVNPGGDVLRGAQKWANTCNRCHEMRDTRELSDKKWTRVVKHMKVRACLTGQDARNIAAFLRATN